MNLKSLDGCRLVIGSYPHFEYDARGGGGNALVIKANDSNIQYLEFEKENFSIPPLTWKTTKFLNLPFPPGLKIEMTMDKLEGHLNTKSGAITLAFESSFIFSIGSIYKFPDLFVKTSLKTGKEKGNLHEAEGNVRHQNGRATLVGIAIIPITGNKVLDLFLGLPNEALAVLKCEIK